MSEPTNDSFTGAIVRRIAPPENDLVPFGKYAGQPVDVLLADASYVDWLRSQPGVMEMLQRRSPTVFNILMVGAPKMDDTPEHNALQAKFLEESFHTHSSRQLLSDMSIMLLFGVRRKRTSR